MGESLVGIGHPVNVFLLADRSPSIVESVQQFIGQFGFHRFPAPGLGVLNDPADGKGRPPLVANLHRHLVSGAADPPGFHFHGGLDVIHG